MPIETVDVINVHPNNVQMASNLAGTLQAADDDVWFAAAFFTPVALTNRRFTTQAGLRFGSRLEEMAITGPQFPEC